VALLDDATGSEDTIEANADIEELLSATEGVELAPVEVGLEMLVPGPEKLDALEEIISGLLPNIPAVEDGADTELNILDESPPKGDLAVPVILGVLIAVILARDGERADVKAELLIEDSLLFIVSANVVTVFKLATDDNTEKGGDASFLMLTAASGKLGSLEPISLLTSGCFEDAVNENPNPDEMLAEFVEVEPDEAGVDANENELGGLVDATAVVEPLTSDTLLTFEVRAFFPAMRQLYLPCCCGVGLIV